MNDWKPIDPEEAFTRNIRRTLRAYTGSVPAEWITALENVLDVTQKRETHD